MQTISLISWAFKPILDTEPEVVEGTAQGDVRSAARRSSTRSAARPGLIGRLASVDGSIRADRPTSRHATYAGARTTHPYAQPRRGGATMKFRKVRSHRAGGIDAGRAVSACADGPGTYTSAEGPTSAGPETSAAQPMAIKPRTPSAADFKDAIDEAQSKQKGQSAHMEASFDLSAGGQSMTMTMSGDYAGGDDPEDSVMNMSIDVLGQKMQMRVVDESLYMKGPGMSRVAGQALGPGRSERPEQPVRSSFTAQPIRNRSRNTSAAPRASRTSAPRPWTASRPRTTRSRSPPRRCSLATSNSSGDGSRRRWVFPSRSRSTRGSTRTSCRSRWWSRSASSARSRRTCPSTASPCTLSRHPPSWSAQFGASSL